MSSQQTRTKLTEKGCPLSFSLIPSHRQHCKDCFDLNDLKLFENETQMNYQKSLVLIVGWTLPSSNKKCDIVQTKWKFNLHE